MDDAGRSGSGFPGAHVHLCASEPSFAGSFGDTRGGDVNVMEQMMNVLTQPFAYIKVLASSIWKTLPSFLFGEDAFRMLGHWGLAGFGTVTMMYFAAVVLTDGSGIVRPVLGNGRK